MAKDSFLRIAEFGTKKDKAVEVTCDDKCGDYKDAFAYASSDRGTQPRQIVFCPRGFDGNQGLSSLTAIKNNQADIPSNAHIDMYRTSLPSTILRSLIHMVGEGVGMREMDGFSQHTYANFVFLARNRPEMAIRCAENYSYFALSMWLEEIDWANGFAQKRPDTEDDDPSADWEAGAIEMEQAQKAREMIDEMVKSQLEYRPADLPRPNRQSHFVAVGQDAVAEL